MGFTFLPFSFLEIRHFSKVCAAHPLSDGRPSTHWGRWQVVGLQGLYALHGYCGKEFFRRKKRGGNIYSKKKGARTFLRENKGTGKIYWYRGGCDEVGARTFPKEKNEGAKTFSPKKKKGQGLFR